MVSLVSIVKVKGPSGLRRARKRQHHAAAEAARDFGDAVKPVGIAADIDRAAALVVRGDDKADDIAG
jgi:hypothetical protein